MSTLTSQRRIACAEIDALHRQLEVAEFGATEPETVAAIVGNGLANAVGLRGRQHVVGEGAVQGPVGANPLRHRIYPLRIAELEKNPGRATQKVEW